jgi:tetratricopeptide (TPR) repeat protein
LYVFGHIGLADAYALLPSYAAVPEQTAYPQAKKAISNAIAINDNIGEAYASLGWIKLLADWDWAGAEQAFEKAVSLNPGYATTYHWFGYLYMILGQFDKSYPLVTRALELDPLSPVLNRVIGDVYRNARQYDNAIPAFQKTLELEPCIPFGHSQLGLCYLQKSMYEEAFDEFLRERECREDSSSTDYLFGLFYAKKGEEAKSREILNQLIARGTNGSGTAQVYFALGDNENGLKILEEMYENRDTWLLYIHSNPEFDLVRTHPRFRNILKKMELIE